MSFARKNMESHEVKYALSYTCLICGNEGKVDFIEKNLDEIQRLSDYVFSLGVDRWKDQKSLYAECRGKFPSVNSKHLQQFLKLYMPKGKYRLPKRPVKAMIVIDNQNFELQKRECKYTDFWLRFSRRNFPLRGKRILQRIPDVKKIQEIRIFRDSREILRCKLTFVDKVNKPTVRNKEKSSGLDINEKCLVISSSNKDKFFSTKELAHLKYEKMRKHRMPHTDLRNRTKSDLHKITNDIVKFLVSREQEVLVLEDLKNLRKSKVNRMSYNKKANVKVHSLPYAMLKDMLISKCLRHGITVEFISPEYTSKTCSHCGSLHTERPHQNSFKCLECDFQLHADVNASRNIRKKYISPDGLPVNQSPNLQPFRVLSDDKTLKAGSSRL